MLRALICTAGLLLGITTTAWGYGFGAIAFDRSSGKWGASYGYASPQAADRWALYECMQHSSHCGVVVRFRGDICAAYAVGPSATGRGAGPSAASARQRANMDCGGVCDVTVWACNPIGGADVPGPSTNNNRRLEDERYKELQRSWCDRTTGGDPGCRYRSF